MNASVEELVSMMEDIKTNITDEQYKKMLDLMNNIHNTIPTCYYEMTFVGTQIIDIYDGDEQYFMNTKKVNKTFIVKSTPDKIKLLENMVNSGKIEINDLTDLIDKQFHDQLHNTFGYSYINVKDDVIDEDDDDDSITNSRFVEITQIKKHT